MKKIITVSLSAFLLLTGCSSGTASGTDVPEEEPEKTEENEQESTETIELSTEEEDSELETVSVSRKPASGLEGAFISTADRFIPRCEPSVMFFSDGTFVFTENYMEGMAYFRGSFTYDKSCITCKADSMETYRKTSESDKEIRLTFINDSQLKLETGINGSFAGDTFIFVNQIWAAGEYVSTADRGFVKGCEPTAVFNSDGTFEVTENLLSRMGKYSGIYQYDGNQYQCKVQSADFSGFKGDDVKFIRFNVNDEGIVLLTELCGSGTGDQFVEGKASAKPSVTPEPTPETTAKYRTGTVYIVANASSNRIKVRNAPGLSGTDTGERKYSGEKVTVYDETVKDGYTWYLIGPDRWMASNGTSFGIKFD